MKIYGEYIRRVTNEDGDIEVTFVLKDFRSKRDAEELKKQTSYGLDIKEPKSKRSLSQNALLWKLIGEICDAENGKRSEADELDIYCNLLQLAGAKCEYFECTKEAYEGFRKQFRAVSVMQEREHKGVKTYMVKVFFGSSSMSVEEMGKLLDVAIDYAENLGINTEYWEHRFEDIGR